MDTIYFVFKSLYAATHFIIITSFYISHFMSTGLRTFDYGTVADNSRPSVVFADKIPLPVAVLAADRCLVTITLIPGVSWGSEVRTANSWKHKYSLIVLTVVN